MSWLQIQFRMTAPINCSFLKERVVGIPQDVEVSTLGAFFSLIQFELLHSR
jgi:hypothetical protein